jgi:hypothetical protein
LSPEDLEEVARVAAELVREGRLTAEEAERIARREIAACARLAGPENQFNVFVVCGRLRSAARPLQRR